MKFKKDFSHEELTTLAALCAGVAILMMMAVFIGGHSGTGPFSSGSLMQGAYQSAATALGDAQGVPPGYTGKTYTADPLCFIQWSYPDYGAGNYAPPCPTTAYIHWGQSQSAGAVDTFSTGIFSIDPGGGAGQSMYATRTYTTGGPASIDLGPASCGDGSTPFTTDGTTYVCGNGSNPCSGYSPPPGYTPPALQVSFGGDSETFECLTSTASGSPIPPVFSAPTNRTSGSAITVAPGQSMTFEWSCLPSRTVDWQLKTGQGFFSSGSWNAGTIYSISPLTRNVTGGGSGFSITPTGAGILTGTQVVAAPATAGTYTYTLTCNGGATTVTDYARSTSSAYSGEHFSIPVTVSGSPVPTVTITGNGQSGSVSVPSGTPVDIVATFNPSGSYTGSAINDFQNNALTSQAAASPKNYTFNTAANPAAPGTYIFNAAVQTSALGWANNFGKSLTVVVTAAPGACQNGQGTAGSCSSCDAGFHLSGGACVPDVCAGGQNNPPACTTCSPGFHTGGSGACVANTCSDPHAIAPLCTCESGYTMSGGVCTLNPPALSLTAAQARVQKNAPASLSWSVTGLVDGSGTQCSISSSPAGVYSTTMPPGTAPTWSGSNVLTGPVTSATIFTLMCTGPESKSITVTLIPSFIEK